MADETITLTEKPDGQFALLQLSLQEETYCQIRAQGETKRAAWKRAFGVEEVNDATLDTRVSRLEKRPEIVARIAEIRREIIEANQAKWEKRREELMEMLYHGALRVAHDPKQGGLPAASKAVTTLAAMLGWNEPQRLEVASGPVGGGALDAKEVSRKVDKLLELTAPKESGGDNAAN